MLAVTFVLVSTFNYFKRRASEYQHHFKYKRRRFYFNAPVTFFVRQCTKLEQLQRFICYIVAENWHVLSNR